MSAAALGLPGTGREPWAARPQENPAEPRPGPGYAKGGGGGGREMPEERGWQEEKREEGMGGRGGEGTPYPTREQEATSAAALVMGGLAVAFSCALLNLSTANRDPSLTENERFFVGSTTPLVERRRFATERVAAVAFAAFFLIFAATGALSQIFAAGKTPPDMKSFSAAGGVVPLVMYMLAAGCATVTWGLTGFVGGRVSTFIVAHGVLGTATALTAMLLSGFAYRDAKNEENWDRSVRASEAQAQDAQARTWLVMNAITALATFGLAMGGTVLLTLTNIDESSLVATSVGTILSHLVVAAFPAWVLSVAALRVAPARLAGGMNTAHGSAKGVIVLAVFGWILSLIAWTTAHSSSVSAPIYGQALGSWLGTNVLIITSAVAMSRAKKVHDEARAQRYSGGRQTGGGGGGQQRR